MTERLPKPHTDKFPTLTPTDVRVLDLGTPIGRIYSAGGLYGTTWNRFRAWGPTQNRFDHHPPPARAHPARRILYVTPNAIGPNGAPYPILKTCLAECFGDRQIVELSRDDPYFAVFESARPLRLLDLADSDWITRAGGNAAISSGLRSRSREWARAIYRHYSGADALDGVIYPSSNIPIARVAALWERTGDALPGRPAFNEPLSHLGLRPAMETFAAELCLALVR